MNDRSSRDRRELGLALLGAVALIRALFAAPEEVSAAVAGEPISLALERLEGPAYRLLPGVGPVLGERLEAARVAAGGRLDEASARRVRGVGSALLTRWRALRLAGDRPLR